MKHSGRPRIAILLMQKNEVTLLPLFLRYHEALAGSQSIYLFDNGSTEPRVLETIRAAEKRGVHVERRHSAPQDFVDKGEIFTRFIQHLDSCDSFDFYFPLDCDEFLACLGPDGPLCSRDAIDEALQPFVGHPGTLVIQHKYWANPMHRNRYMISTHSRKCFFAHGSCSWLDHGYHHARSHTNTADTVTPIVYLEFHYRPYREHQKASREKILPFHRHLTRRCLRDYVAQAAHSHHCAADLLQTKIAYISQFTPEAFPLHDTSLLKAFAEFGIDPTHLFEPQPPLARRWWLIWLHLRGHLSNGYISVRDWFEDVMLALPHWWRWLRKRLRRG